ncbi:hypothetical protein COEREDRAFT_89795 [Coemansia reversa NRRL 1564]|uniref:Uncharacterized protein n=1 Tax=Coemansia reversa (strain ATCC 12441 / NRRL 1564) TaxID=763665 RepID=A0A2G5B2C1_COERN|nr:hypothetical protein COEREDRAFT_89795 [Coemansia reversa NRRL 1564]|eukprot:PIA13156.1 hypothetical protein COEREDRAFT_89795 [Coemansia reversa NRRL 1564]
MSSKDRVGFPDGELAMVKHSIYRDVRKWFSKASDQHRNLLYVVQKGLHNEHGGHDYLVVSSTDAEAEQKITGNLIMELSERKTLLSGVLYGIMISASFEKAVESAKVYCCTGDKEPIMFFRNEDLNHFPTEEKLYIMGHYD